jgi:hypothetical protein
MSVPGAATSVADLVALSAEGYGTFLYGQDRHALLRVAYALARLNDPNPYWVDIRPPTRLGDPDDPVGLGWIPDDHLFVVEQDEARPLDAEANMALWTVLRSDEPKSAITAFTDFLRLPRQVQRAVGSSRSDVGRPVFVFANADRVRAHYSTTSAGVRPYVDSMLRAGIVPIFASAGQPGPGRWAFDFVFEVRTPQLSDWSGGTLACERAPPGLAVVSGQVRPLLSVPGLAR